MFPVSASALWAFHTNPGGFARLCPPWQSVRLASASGDFAHLRAVIELKQGPLRLQWHAQHENYVEGRQFQDRQLKGPFARWVHTHTVEPVDANSASLDDQISYDLPLGALGRLIMGSKIKDDLDAMFAFRHERTRHDCVAHARFADLPRMHIGITGSTGLIGSELCAYLLNAGHQVTRMLRAGTDRRLIDAGAPALERVIDFASPVHELARSLEGLDAVVHLAAAPIAAHRWSSRRKQTLVSSRVETTAALARALAVMQNPPRHFIVASGTAGYATQGREPATEKQPLDAQGFLADLVRQWEAAADPARAAGLRVAHLRIGMVLSPRAGALRSLLTPARLGMLGTIGGGQQRWPWIALDDLLAAVEHVLHTPALDGPVNCVSPSMIDAQEMTRILARTLGRPHLIPAPAGLLRAAMGEIASVLLEDHGVRPAKLQASGFEFSYADLSHALALSLGCAAADDRLIL